MVNRQRNPKARCGNCPHMWRGKENITYGVDSIIELEFLKCTKDQKFIPIREDQFCESHPNFWLDSHVGIKAERCQAHSL